MYGLCQESKPLPWVIPANFGFYYMYSRRTPFNWCFVTSHSCTCTPQLNSWCWFYQIVVICQLSHSITYIALVFQHAASLGAWTLRPQADIPDNIRNAAIINTYILYIYSLYIYRVIEIDRESDGGKIYIDIFKHSHACLSDQRRTCLWAFL